ncbi:MAG TPA: lytic transglycosylase domain-containing protein [Terriglobales bacterium]|nr:lytic transglycosylase domain-containing protein [Terriglobales bacterium]
MPSLRQLGAITAVLLSTTGFAADVAILQNGFSIRHEHRQVVGPVTRLYTTPDNSAFVDIPTADIDHFEKDLTPVTAPAALAATAPAVRKPLSIALPQPKALDAKALNEVINSISDRHKIDPDLINSVIHAESGFNSRAVSPKGARGLMQLMPQTANQLGVNNSFDPEANVEGGTRYLRELLEQYNFDIVKALAAYNAGPHRVEQYHGVPPYYETRAYVAKIIREFNRKKLAERKATAKSPAVKSAKKPAPSKPAPAAETSESIQPTPSPQAVR